MNEISTEKILAEIRADIAAKGYKISELKFSRISLQNTEFFNEELFRKALVEASAKWQVELYPSVSGNKIKRFVKKLIRKFVRPSFIGTLKKQEEFNQNSVTALTEISKKIRELDEKITELEKRGEVK